MACEECDTCKHRNDLKTARLGDKYGKYNYCVYCVRWNSNFNIESNYEKGDPECQK